MPRRHHRIIVAGASGILVVAAAVAAVLAVRARGNSTPPLIAAGTPAAAETPRPTPGGPYTPSPLIVVHSLDDALRLAAAYGTDLLQSYQISSVNAVKTTAGRAWRTFRRDPRLTKWSVPDTAPVWAIVAYGTFVRFVPGANVCPCTYHTAWALAVQGSTEVYTDFDATHQYDLSKLGPVISVPESKWASYVGPSHIAPAAR